MHPALKHILLKGVGGSASFVLADLFAAGANPGFDLTDLDITKTWGADSFKLMHSDTVGTFVTATGQAVASIIDKSLGLTLGSELVTNGDFSSATGWTKDAGWTIAAGKATHAPSAGAEDILRTITFAAGDAARSELTVSGRAAGTMNWTSPIGDNAAPTSANGVYLRGDVASVANQVRARASAPFDGSIDDVSVKKILGYPLRQTSSSSRPVYTEAGASKYLVFDGGDDHLTTLLSPAASMTLAACFRASGASQNIIGSTAAANADRCYLSTDSAGLIAGGWGSDSPTTIKGGSAIGGTTVVALLRANASTVELWLNGEIVYSGAANGAPNTTVPMTVGARSVAGTIGSYLNGRIHRAVAVQQYIPDAAVLPLMQLLGGTDVVF